MNCKHGLEPDECSLCISQAKRVDKFQLKESFFKGNPTVEILVDGKSFPYDTAFSFGCWKARLILTCMEAIEEFVRFDDDMDLSKFNNLYLDNSMISVDIEYHDEFIHSSGAVIRKPWIKLSTNRSGIAFGSYKAQALFQLKHIIREWVASKCH